MQHYEYFKVLSEKRSTIACLLIDYRKYAHIRQPFLKNFHSYFHINNIKSQAINHHGHFTIKIQDVYRITMSCVITPAYGYLHPTEFAPYLSFIKSFPSVKAKTVKRLFNGFFVEFLKLIIQSFCGLISIHLSMIERRGFIG